jgi:branched-chain amino acid transport system substrate-binding protein
VGSTGADLIGLSKQAREFGAGTKRTQVVASFVLTTPDIAALGLPAAQGVLVNEAFYWDLDDGTRAFARRFAAVRGAERRADAVDDPGWRSRLAIQAGDYSVIRAYLRAAAATRTTDTATIMRRLHDTPIDDPLVRNASGAQREPAAGWADGARHVSVPGEDAGAIDGAVRLLRAGGDHSGRGGVPAAVAEPVPAMKTPSRSEPD